MREPHMPDHARDARRIWEAFVSGEAPDLGHLYPAIRSSWIRSRRHGINPRLLCAPVEFDSIDDEEIRLTVPWLGAAEPSLKLLHSALSEPHQLVLLTDYTGRVLRAHAGAKARARAEELNVIVGSNWSEAKVGCTAIGACLHDDAPVLANWCESYSCNWHDWVNQAVPLHDPITRKVIGGINVAGFREIIHPAVLDLALRTAEFIEVAIDQQDWRFRAVMLERFQRLQPSISSDASFAVDRRGRLIAFNEMAERRFRLSGTHVGMSVDGLNLFSDIFSPADVLDDGFNRRTRPNSGVDVIEVNANQISGAIYIVPASKQRRSSQAWPTRYTFNDLIGNSAPFQECLEHARRAANEHWPVLVMGESGSGKELLAHAIHAAGPRQKGPFVAFSCAGVSDELVAAELFGYSPGSFTGATKDGQIGKIEVAHRGTLFLDDVDCMPAKMQASLLRVIEDNVVLPVGAVSPRQVDVRIIAATNADLERACADGRFRPDLYHRLNVIALLIPPLRERAGDIARLAPYILGRLGVHKSISEDAMAVLCDYRWPGNVRELRNVLIRSGMRAQGPVIKCADLPDAIRLPVNLNPASSSARSMLVRSAADARERDQLLSALAGSVSVLDAAAKLDIHFTTVYRRMRKHGIETRFKRWMVG